VFDQDIRKIMLERLQKIIARAGLASRRHAEELIKSGLVTVNGQTITELGSKADECTDHIKVQGKLLRPQTERVYLLLNKPPEVVSTMIDPEGRRTLTDLLYGISHRVFPVGRLEYHSMGLVFLTNDGELANLMLKAHQLPQTYQLKLKTLLTFEEIENLSRSTGAQINRIKGKDAPWYEVTLSEARRDALRNRLFQTGHPVEKIKRVKIGNLAMESLPTGHHRPLSDAEVATLRRIVQPSAAAAKTAAEIGAPEIQPGTLSTHIVAAAPAVTGFRPPAAANRRPFVKRRPFQRKPKPGQGPRTSYGSALAGSAEGFKPATPSHARPYSQPERGFQPARPGAPSKKPFAPRRPYKDSRTAAAGRPDFNSKNPGPHDRQTGGPWRPDRRPSEPGDFGRGKKPFRPSESAEAKPGARWKSIQKSAGPGAFGRSKQKFTPGRPSGIKSGGPKRGGSPGPKPHRGRYTGPKGRS
jgi:23S rRNA pseudouridine2605 synthase